MKKNGGGNLHYMGEGGIHKSHPKKATLNWDVRIRKGEEYSRQKKQHTYRTLTQEYGTFQELKENYIAKI